jgi:hypothetical protein
MSKKVKFEILADEYFEIGRKMRRAAIAWLKVQLKKIPSMDFTYLDYQVSCCYNGGAHPEYASDCFSMIEGVYIENGKIYLHIEDCDSYEIEELSTDEVFDLCDYVKNVYLPERNEDYENTPVEER